MIKENHSLAQPFDPGDSATLISLFVPALLGSYLLLTSTATLIPGIWLYDAKRILQFGLMLALFLVPVLNGRIRDEFGSLIAAVPRWLRLIFLAIFTWGTVSVLVNAQSLMHALNSFSEVALLCSLVVGVFVVAACRRIAGRWFDRIAIALIALTGLAVGLQELIGVVAAQNAGLEFRFRISLLHFSWPRFYNQVQSWTIPVLAALPFLFPRRRMVYFLCALVLGLQWYIILMTGARGSFVSLGAAFLFALVLIPPIRSRLLKWQIVGFILGALLYAVVAFYIESGGTERTSQRAPTPGQGEVSRQTDSGAGKDTLEKGQSSFFKESLGKSMASSSGRTEMWSITVRDARENPLLGIGPMNYVCTSDERIGHPHNFPLQIGAEWGIPVAIILCLLIPYLVLRASYPIRRREFDSPDDAVLAGLLLTGLIAALFHACLSGVLVMPASQVTGLLVCGVLVGLQPSVPGERAVPGLKWVFIPPLVLTVGLLGLGSYELATMKSREVLLKPGATMWPRTWQDAKVCQLYLLQNEVKY